ncbi:cytochrome P450 [Xylona heveae TC161]|uniref:Cytochrome P450 n=1 Tax=Xylona heveae (strain CBS 132557 / TC161) TaxID=1328760 RepID=A0A165JYB3_XYLHT|nr:cytochrome P450 [Xylona heveae TC161]KZF26779.1 cytochrome P450 [Xylona heveae TC161]
MLSSAVEEHILWWRDEISKVEFTGAHPIVLAGVLLLLWRLWRFTINPALHPSEPKEVPYWIPFVGHAVSYVRDSFKTITFGREYFRNDRKPFALNLAGEKLYIITGPADVSVAYKNTATLTMDIFLQELMKGFEISPAAIGKMYWHPGSDGSGQTLLSPNPHRKSLVHLTTDLYRQQLHPGEKMETLGNLVCDHISMYLSWNNMTGPEYVVAEGNDFKDISLLHLCEHVLLNAATRSFFGDKLLEIDPDMLKSFLQYDGLSWKLMYRLPTFLAKDMHGAKHRLIRALEIYFSLPKDERPGANWFMQTQEMEQRALGVEVKDMAKLVAMIYWVINTNAYKLCFWMLSYLYHHPSSPSIRGPIEAELRASFDSQGSLDLAYLQNKTPYLNALYLESLRLTNSSASARFIKEDTQVGGFTLRAGNKLLIPYRQLHLNAGIFGEDANEFDLNRFLKNPKLSHNPSFRPYGGGQTMCPGRFMAKQEVFAMMAMLANRYDIEVKSASPSQKFPRLDELKPGIGIMGPVEGEDLILRLRRRT